MAKRVFDVKFVGNKTINCTTYSQFLPASKKEMIYIPNETCYGKDMRVQRKDKVFMSCLVDLCTSKAVELGLPCHPYYHEETHEPLFAHKGGPYKPATVVKADDLGVVTKVTDPTRRVVYDTTGAVSVRNLHGDIEPYTKEEEFWLGEVEFVADERGPIKLGQGIQAKGCGDPSTFRGGFPSSDPETISKLWELLGMSDEMFVERYKKEVVWAVGIEETMKRQSQRTAERLMQNAQGLRGDEEEEETVGFPNGH